MPARRLTRLAVALGPRMRYLVVMRVVVMASGQGTLFETLVRASRSGDLKAQIVGLVTNRKIPPVAQRAKALNIPWASAAREKDLSLEVFDQTTLQALQSFDPQWIVLAGYLALLGPQVLSRFAGRVVNVHPSLLPHHGGQGMYGRKVHEAVKAAGDSETGITVHLVDGQYDHGPIVRQVRCAVEPEDTVDQIEAKVRALEYENYPRILNELLTRS
jgi:phosphoribosylglycinamide formyltransferase 1